MVNLSNVLAITIHRGQDVEGGVRVSVIGTGTQLDFTGDDARYFMRMFSQSTGFRTPEGKDLDP